MGYNPIDQKKKDVFQNIIYKRSTLKGSCSSLMSLLSPNNRKKKAKAENKKNKKKSDSNPKKEEEESKVKDKWYSFKIRTYGNMPNMANLYYHSIVPLGNILLMFGGWQVDDASNSTSRRLNSFVYQLDISTKFCKQLSSIPILSLP